MDQFTSAPLNAVRFGFDTVFDADGGIASAPPPRRQTLTNEEVEAIRQAAYAEGERSALARSEAAVAAAVRDAADSARIGLAVLAQAAHDHRVGSAELAMTAARKMAGAALALFPEAAPAAALEAMIREIEANPRLIIRTGAQHQARVQEALEQAAQRAGFTGQISALADPTLPEAAFILDWGDGRASYDPHAAAARIETALHDALASEGLHAEPLIINEADHG